MSLLVQTVVDPSTVGTDAYGVLTRRILLEIFTCCSPVQEDWIGLTTSWRPANTLIWVPHRVLAIFMVAGSRLCAPLGLRGACLRTPHRLIDQACCDRVLGGFFGKAHQA